MTIRPARENRDPPILLVDSNGEWPAEFEKEKLLIQPALKPFLVSDIEHIGSTAISGLKAKPIIDIMAPVKCLASSKDAIAKVEALGYHYWPYKAEIMHWFCKPDQSHRTHHLHLVPFNSELWMARIKFRDKLRASSALADEYSVLKQRLALAHKFDRELYTEGKTNFVNRVVSA